MTLRRKKKKSERTQKEMKKRDREVLKEARSIHLWAKTENDFLLSILTPSFFLFTFKEKGWDRGPINQEGEKRTQLRIRIKSHALNRTCSFSSQFPVQIFWALLSSYCGCGACRRRSGREFRRFLFVGRRQLFQFLFPCDF